MKVLICGGRGFRDKQFVDDYLDEWVTSLYDKNPYFKESIIVIHGGALGVDTWADSWAIRRKYTIKEYQPDWDKYGRAAGPIRNKQMLDEGKPDLVIAFPGGRGTANMIKQAKEAGVEVEIVSYP